MGSQSAAIRQVILDFLRHEANGSPDMNEWQPSFSQVEDGLNAYMEEFGHFSGSPQVLWCSQIF
jgi:hypothetical protein